jgi:hypothetical protein
MLLVVDTERLVMDPQETGAAPVAGAPLVFPIHLALRAPVVLQEVTDLAAAITPLAAEAGLAE